MKLVRHGNPGQEKPGILDEAGQVRDLSGVIPALDAKALSRSGLDALRRLDVATLPLVAAGMRLGSCVERPGNFIAIGLNYTDHAAESNLPVPKEPIVFNKAPSSLAGPNDALDLPNDALKGDWEVELGVVIGTQAYRLAPGQGLDVVAGYCICNDISERAWQLERGGQWAKGKSAPGFGPLGPWLVTADEIADPQALTLSLTLNGVTMQSGSSADMIFSVEQIIVHLSQFMRLEPGDVIVTGTPAGVGVAQKPPRFLRDGDLMELEISGLGRQRQQIVQPSSTQK